MNEMELVYKWLEKAKNDLIVAEHTFEDLYPKQIEICCYHCQQATEKILKGYLEYKNIEPPKTHNLVMLCQMCMEIDTEFIEIIECCSDLTPYSITTRYPNEIEIMESEAVIALKQSKEVFNFVVSKIPLK